MLNDEQWDRLKYKYKNLSMHMPCCQTRAIPKKSKLGTQYFAHHPSSTCSTLLVKALSISSVNISS